jgi:hypothetical protein
VGFSCEHSQSVGNPIFPTPAYQVLVVAAVLLLFLPQLPHPPLHRQQLVLVLLLQALALLRALLGDGLQLLWDQQRGSTSNSKCDQTAVGALTF